jgi:hypothetical protein
MHCPRCGQQQVSEEIKFCSRCGFPLALVGEILAQGGFLPQLADLDKDKKWLTRSLGFKLGLLWFIVLCFILLPLAAITKAPDQVIGGLFVIGFGGALLVSMLSFMFLPKRTRSTGTQSDAQNQTPQFSSGNSNRTNALPPQTTQPVSAYAPPANSWKAADTGDLSPRTVTEGTTKLLQKDE